MGSVNSHIPRPAAGTAVGERYRLDHVIGRGGMATVWLAEDEVLGRDVAVKLLSADLVDDPQYLARFEREAKVAASLTHPNLVRVYDFGLGPEHPYLAMEYIGGGDLAQRLREQAPVDAEALAEPLLNAVRHIHEAGVIHRDIKPGNVLFEPSGRVRLTDFGIAQREDALSLTRTGDVLGTLKYLAPERLRGEPACERTDLYSCGVLLAECLDGSSSPALVALVEQLRDEDPHQRPASASAALAALRAEPEPEFAAEPTAEAPTDEIKTAPLSPAPLFASSEPSRGPRIWVGAGILAIALAVLAIVLLSDSGDGDGEPISPVSDGAIAEQGDPAAEGEAGEEPAVAEETPAPSTESPPPGEGDDPARGIELNQQGYELLQAGDAAGAIPILEEAVSMWPEGSKDVEYGYALFNLAQAYRLAGRPEEAIPLLEERLTIDDQIDTVEAELALAREAAGLTSDEDDGSGFKEEKPPKGESEGNAFGHEKDD